MCSDAVALIIALIPEYSISLYRFELDEHDDARFLFECPMVAKFVLGGAY
jgi:hypothetical protein